MKLKITNFFYQLNGHKYWFISFRDALLHMRDVNTELYFNCLNPEDYIQSKISQFDLEGVQR